ncbi:butyrophilin subfamily 1 member A1 isoform X4 [Alligator mississippiensis]|uniref:butyrophilin subfamily 1 member A1 isoform X4 n=1 Tax=Alligator mississippiensis TaxID=8496 RepID=UPI002877F79A|nr:butyrophilin subfamily 1 member A1 isoform X4 [Alligator mississippiensis]
MPSSLCQISRVSTSLPGFLTFFITFHICKVESALFTVVGPDQPITAIVGEEIVLPCRLSPSMSAANMEVRWFRPGSTNDVHLYRDGRDQFGGQMPEYERRTEFWKDGITDGNVSLRILNIGPSDEGLYICLVEDDITYKEAVIELKVAALGSNPIISVEDYQKGGIRVTCQSAEWYPEPQTFKPELVLLDQKQPPRPREGISNSYISSLFSQYESLGGGAEHDPRGFVKFHNPECISLQNKRKPPTRTWVEKSCDLSRAGTNCTNFGKRGRALDAQKFIQQLFQI